jgi:hypothetical protein
MRNSGKFTDARAEELKAMLADGIDAIATDEGWQRYLAFQSRFPEYSFGNLMLILRQRPDATLVQAKGRRADGKHTGWYAAGRTPVDGAVEIWIWKRYTGSVDDPTKEDGKRRFTKFWPVPVFDVADTEGEPLPEQDVVRLLEGDDEAGLLKPAVAFIEAAGWECEFVPSIPGSPANGDMNPAKKIRVCTEGRSGAQQAKTALHEAAHMILHSSGKGISIPRSQKEAEAESAAFIVASHFGMSTGIYSFGYVAGWIADTGFTARTAIKHSGKRIQRAAKEIIGFIDPGAVDDATWEDDL